MVFRKTDNALMYQNDKEKLLIEVWGENSFRVRATQNNKILNDEHNTLENPKNNNCEIIIRDDTATIINGSAKCCVSKFGVISFYNGNDLVLKEYDRNRYSAEESPICSALEISPRMYEPIVGTDNYKLKVRFEADENEKFFGMGQYQHANLDLKGCIIELAHRNSQISIPFVLSSNGYGMLWNNPAIGEVAFANNLTQWESVSTKQVDYWITISKEPSTIMERYTSFVGRAPEFPHYAMGFWQCKLRYQTQEELLTVAREYNKRGIALDVIVADFFHWEHEGEWAFDPIYWPDPKAMVDELKQMGTKLMVSIWPTVEENSKYYKEMKELGYLVRSEVGSRLRHLGNACYFDVTNEDARKYMWSKIKANYYDKGIDIFWLDEAEPEYTGYDYSNIRYSIGSDLEKGNLYPKYYAKMAYDGMKECNQEKVINLIRCAWVGSQKYASLVWSGDIESTFSCLRNQVVAGLNMGIAGIPWWTTDIGGFHNGNVNDPNFIELLIRWFQFGVFSPVFRLHGVREPMTPPLSQTGGGKCPSGAPNEIWSYGEKAYNIFTKYITLREKMKPYIEKTLDISHKKGYPVIRPMFFNIPKDETSWNIRDQYFFGDDMLVCPILYDKMRERQVYLPVGTSWRNIFDNKTYKGGQTINISAPIDIIPVFVKQGTLEYLSYN